MKLNIPRGWYDATSSLEDDLTVGAGILAMHPSPADFLSDAVEPHEETRIAFGKFISLSRRKRHLTIENLAEKANLDISELVAIEQSDPHFIPEPRSVWELARYLDVSTDKLMTLAGLKRAKQPGLAQEAMKFAARSASVDNLSDQEIEILESFVSVLNEKSQ